MGALPNKSANEMSLFNPLDGQDTHASLKSTHTSEIVIALCGPIGSPLHDVAKTLEDTITQRYGYTCQTIRLSDFIVEHFDKVGGNDVIPQSPKDKRVESLIKGGDFSGENLVHQYLQI